MSTMSPIFDQIKANVDRCGLHIQGVFPSAEGPGFTYTIGFTRLGLPEVICFGLDMKMIAPFMNRYYDEIVNQKTRDAGPGMLMPEDNWFNLPLSVINAEQSKASVHACQAFYFACDMKWDVPNFVQWVWCDHNGLFPWQKGFDGKYFPMQPILGRFM